MHLPIKVGIQEAKKELGALRYDMEDTVCYLESFEYLIRGLMVQKMKEARPPKSELNKRLNPGELGATVQGIGGARSSLDGDKTFLTSSKKKNYYYYSIQFSMTIVLLL